MLDDTPDEQWRAIPGYKGIYAVSTKGRVYSLPGYKKRGNRILTWKTAANSGYPYVNLWRENVGKDWTIHALVALTFLGPRPEGHLVLHWDDNPMNPQLSNLRYGTYGDNVMDARRNGINPHGNKTHCLRGHEYDDKNTYLNTAGHRTCRACARLRPTRKQRLAARAAASA